MAHPKLMMTGESCKMMFHTVLHLNGMEHVHHLAGGSFSFLQVDSDTGLEILHVHAMIVLESQFLGQYLSWGGEVQDRRLWIDAWHHENHHSSPVHQSPPVLFIPTYASLLEGASVPVEEDSRAALLDMFQVIGHFKGHWMSTSYPLSSNHLNTSCPNPLPVVVTFISNVICRLGAKLAWHPDIIVETRNIYRFQQRAWQGLFGPSPWRSMPKPIWRCFDKGKDLHRSFSSSCWMGWWLYVFTFLLLRVLNNCLV